MHLRWVFHAIPAVMMLMVLTISHARSDMLLGGASAEKYLVRHMAESRNNFDCDVFFLQNHTFSREQNCSESNEYIGSLLKRKGISASDGDEIRRLEKKVLEFLFHSIDSRM
ncbi:MAG: hypothetical protein J0I79_26455 [Mesorhizobium sp.]|uniref:hypothetical protein n=1 Tax=Mesorhizobium sp. TaxID=1871066 RepID=UPI001AC37307|nr:hypothetical protein [Mesorhizobium sp.]MBN9221501.1 hypothetical protein [Mesorhizobium sp.]